MKHAIEIILRKVQNLTMSIEEAQALLEVMSQEKQTIIINQKIEPYNIGVSHTGGSYPTCTDVVYSLTIGKQQINI